MKKILTIIAAIMIIAGLAGCSWFNPGRGHGRGKGPGKAKMKSNKGGTKIMVK